MGNKGCARRAREAYTSVDVREDVESSILQCSIYYVSFAGIGGTSVVSGAGSAHAKYRIEASDIKVDPILLVCTMSHNLIDPPLPHERMVLPTPSICVPVTAALCPFKVRATDSSWKSAAELGSAEMILRDMSDEAESST